MSPWQLFTTALIVGLSGALMPGPLLTLNIRESMRRGPATGFKLILGHVLLELALILAILAGFGGMLALGPVKGAIGLAGGAVLLFLAYGMIREAVSGLSLNKTDEPSGRGCGLPLIPAGAVISLSNPYWSLWWATIGLSYLARARELAAYGVGLFFLGHILADLTWYSAISIAVAGGKRLFSDRVYRAIVLACGVFLVYIAFWFMDSAFGFFSLAKPSALLWQTVSRLWRP